MSELFEEAVNFVHKKFKLFEETVNFVHKKSKLFEEAVKFVQKMSTLFEEAVNLSICYSSFKIPPICGAFFRCQQYDFLTSQFRNLKISFGGQESGGDVRVKSAQNSIKKRDESVEDALAKKYDS